MQTVSFTEAKAVFFPFGSEAERDRVRHDEAVGHYGFYTTLTLPDPDDPDGEEVPFTADEVMIRLTARNVYRLFVNGELVMHGPARTAHGYARVDEFSIADYLTDGINHIAVEVVMYGGLSPAYNAYSNDCTLEPPLFIAEIEADGVILSATGADDWQVTRITSRVANTERISHCREASEIYVMDEQYDLWKAGYADFVPAAVLDAEPVYLPHTALLPTLAEIPVEQLIEFGSCSLSGPVTAEPQFYERNAYFSALPEHLTADARATVETAFAGSADRGDEGLTLSPADGQDAYALFDLGESHVGFVEITFTAEKAGTVDLFRSEILTPEGELSTAYNLITRLHVGAGFTSFITMEPGLLRYLKVTFRGTGVSTIHHLAVRAYSYPDEHRVSFLTSDENVNRLYGAAKRTLLLNTLDIFMDCPDRERGGWLCDSLWTARAAAAMLADSRVEREFLENFLLTEHTCRDFFPEVYPGNKAHFDTDLGITTWSFWMMAELCEYVRRTGDTAFAAEHKARVAAFVAGAGTFIGKSGLLENMPHVFIDWSLSNLPEYNSPVSTPANALFAYALCELGDLFGEPEWVKQGQAMRDILRAAILGGQDARTSNIDRIPDSFNVTEDGSLRSRGRFSESAMVTALWSGLFSPDEMPRLRRRLRDESGPAPRYPADPTIGQSEMFIGLCIRLDTLARFGLYDRMFEDLRAIYEPQLREGPGTLWENNRLDNSSRCHGFNAHAGVHLIRDVLGLGIPAFTENGEGDRIVELAPHLCGLRWARGTQETPDGLLSVRWSYDGDRFVFQASLPAGYRYTFTLPREIRGLDEKQIEVQIVVRQ